MRDRAKILDSVVISHVVHATDDSTTAISLHERYPIIFHSDWTLRSVYRMYVDSFYCRKTNEKRHIFPWLDGGPLAGVSSAVNAPITSRLFFSKRILIFSQFIYRIPRHIIFRFIALEKIQRSCELPCVPGTK